MLLLCLNQKIVYCISVIFTLLFVIPVLILITLPMLIYRQIISLLWSISHRFDGSTIVSPTSSTCAIDDILVNPTCSVVVTMEFVNCDSVEFSGKIATKLLRLIDSGKYPELTYSLTTWSGFSFWKRDRNFNITDHFHLIDSPMSQTQVDNFKQHLIQRPYSKDKPLWDFTVIPKIEEQGTVLLLRIHHCLADGQSIINLMNTLRDSAEPWTQRSPNFKNRSNLQSILFALKVLICGPTDLIIALWKGQDTNAWKLKKYSRKINCAESKQIPLEDFKGIATVCGVSMTSVLIAGLTGAVRNLMLKHSLDDNVQLPDHMTIICPFPLSGHSDNLSNHVTMVPVRVPLGQPNPYRRVREIEEEIQNLKDSTLPLIFSIGLRLIGSFPKCIITSQSKSGIGTAVLSNFPGPNTAGEVCGYSGSKLSIMSGIAHGILGVNCGVISYNGKVQISVGLDEAISFDRTIVTDFLESLIQEFRVLSHNDANKHDSRFLNLRKIEVV